jgi:hypothetical protein
MRMATRSLIKFLTNSGHPAEKGEDHSADRVAVSMDSASDTKSTPRCWNSSRARRTPHHLGVDFVS